MPGLSDYQRDLAAAVRQRQAAALWDPSAPGLALTGRIRESWCNGRARRAADEQPTGQHKTGHQQHQQPCPLSDASTEPLRPQARPF